MHGRAGSVMEGGRRCKTVYEILAVWPASGDGYLAYMVTVSYAAGWTVQQPDRLTGSAY